MNKKQSIKKAGFRFFVLIFFYTLTPKPYPLLYAAFEESSVGARIVALGGASAALPSGADSLSANPAMLAELLSPEVAAGYSRLHAGLSDSSELSRASLAFGYPLGGFSFGAGYDGLALTGVYDETTISAAAAYDLWGRIALGAAYRHRGIKIQTDPYLAADPLFAVGDYAKSFPEYALGMRVRAGRFIFGAYGASLDEANEIYKTPAPNVVGFSYEENGFTFAADYITGRDRRMCAVGAEKLLFGNILAARGGFSFGDRDFRKVTAGVGLRVSNIGADYAVEYPLSGIVGISGTHRFTFSARFSESAAPVETKKAPRPARPPVSKPPAPQNKISFAPETAKLASPTGLPPVLALPISPSSSPAAGVSSPAKLASPLIGKVEAVLPPPATAQAVVVVEKSSAAVSVLAERKPAAVSVSSSVIPVPVSQSYDVISSSISEPATRPVSYQISAPPTILTPAPPAARTHKVRAGETLASISEKYYGSVGEWMKIYRANEDKIEKGIVKPGEVLIIP